jgi:hypothetical protein
MTRDELERTILAATTPVELDEARQLGQDWLAEHPEDDMFITSMMDQFEMLSMAHEEGRLP